MMMYLITTLSFVLYLNLNFLVAQHLRDNTGTNPNALCDGLPKLDVLPGKGWDNLRNKDMAQVTALTYTQCKTTPDGKLLIPDNTFATPVKQSDVQLFAEIIDKWTNFTSVTSQSFNMNFDIGLLDLSGSFSSDYQTTKQKQVDEKATTFRVHARYTMYVIATVPSITLDQQLLYLLYTAIEALEHNNTEKADYILELIVRDYGTHMVTRMDAGGIIMKEDFVNRKYVYSYTGSSSELKAAASASFSNIFNFSASYKQSTNRSIIDAYEKNITSSSVTTIGGLFFKPNQIIDDWIETLYINLVGTDRKGDPLDFAITPYAFSNVSLKMLDNLRTKFVNATQNYYTYNTHRGCMNLDSPNFDFNANTDSRRCEDPFNNYTFGGVYQTCETNRLFSGQYCIGLALKNPLTGGYSCQTYYTPIFLKNGSTSHSECRQECDGILFWRSCHTRCNYFNTVYSAYWCAAVNGNVPNNTGVMFGGVYTEKVNNPQTQSGSCPPTYFDLVMLNDLHVCISNDYELGRKYSLDFGGFFSCRSGNPLYTNLKKKLYKYFASTNDGNSNLNDYVSACPGGYSQHTAIIDQECVVYYCVLSHSFSSHGYMPIVLPPFRSFHSLFDEPLKYLKSNQQSNDDHKRVSDKSIAFGAIVSVCFVLILACIGFFVWRKKTRTDSEYIPINQSGYNAVVEES